jgi:hemerythrin-like domain-containing protein
MMPVGPLMIEHRLIERMLKVAEQKLQEFEQRKTVDVAFILSLVDFFRTYADRCHHGKEEDILFRELAKKKLKEQDRKIMDELIEEHKIGRKYVGALFAAGNRYTSGDQQTYNEIRELVQTLLAFYPVHIAKEDKQFFIPVMEYFSKEEQAAMIAEGYAFDQHLIHTKYKETVEQYEKKTVNGTPAFLQPM